MKAVVVDPGGDTDQILRAIKELGVEVEKIILTHGHIDHAGGAHNIKAALGINIVGPDKGDLFLLETLAETGAMYGITGAHNCTSDHWLTDGEELKVGELIFDVLHCPGHSPGSVVYYNKDNKLAIVGDVLFAGSIGRSDLPQGNHDQLMQSIADKLLTLPDDVAFISGHGPVSTIGQEKKTNPFLQG